MTPSTPSARSFLRGRHLPLNQRSPNKVTRANKMARMSARSAKEAASIILGKVGLRWTDIVGTHLTGDRLLAYMKAAALTKPHGFVPGQEPTYKHLHPTKGYRFVPA